MNENETVVITGVAQIEGARWLAVRSALKLEIAGMKRRGRSARVLANAITGQDHRTARAAYAALDAHITGTLGAEFARPLPEGK